MQKFIKPNLVKKLDLRCYKNGDVLENVGILNQAELKDDANADRATVRDMIFQRYKK